MWLIWVIEGRMDWSLVGWIKPSSIPLFFAKYISSVITEIIDDMDFRKKKGDGREKGVLGDEVGQFEDTTTSQVQGNSKRREMVADIGGARKEIMPNNTY